MEMPSFLQSKQSTSPEYFLNDRKKKLGILVLAVLVFAIPLTVWLAQRAQIFNPSAAGGAIELVSGADSCVLSNDPNKVSCASFPIKLTSPLGPPTQLVSCRADNQCPAGNKCFNSANYPGSCRPAETVCAQVITRACSNTNPNECADFPTPCHVPPGWVVASGNASPSPSPSPSASAVVVVSPSPSASAAASCTTTALSKTPTVNNSTTVSYTYTYPESTKIMSVNFAAQPGIRYWMNNQSNPSGQALSVNLGAGTSSFSFAVISDVACGAFTAPFTMVNSCGTTMSDFVGVGSASGYGAVCQGVNETSPVFSASKAPTTSGSTTGVSSGTDTLGVNLQSQGLCQNGFPIVLFSNQGRSDTNNFKLYRDGSPLSYTFAGTMTRPPITQMKDTGLNLNTTYSYYIQAVDGPLAGQRSNTSTVTTQSSCPVSGYNFLRNILEGVRSGLVSEVSAQTSPKSVTMSAAPNPCPVGASGVCTSRITWSSLNAPDLRITVKENPGSLFAQAPSGSQDAPWITTEGATFEAYSGEDLLGSLFVDGDSSGIGKSMNFSAAPNPCVVGPSGFCTSTITWASANAPDLRITVKENPGSLFAQAPSGSQQAPWISTAGATFEAYSGSTLVGTLFVDGEAPASASQSPSQTASGTPSANLPGTSFYKVAETEAGLTGAAVLPYTTQGLIYDFSFSSGTPGVRQIWAEFIGADGSTKKEHIAVEIVEPSPQITSLDCSLDISKQNLKITVNGSRFGTGNGKIVVDSKDAQILSWDQNQVTATVKPDGNLDNGKLFKVQVTRSDSKILPEVNCQVGTTLISLGARLFCREPGKFDLNGVKVTLVDENGNKVDEEVTVDSAGIIKNLKTKLQVGKLYAISVKAPYSLRKNAQFMAASGTNVISPADGQPFILPVGDIAPVILQDGKINTLDRSEIVRQWSILGSATKTGDFNRDTKINSIDWACMRYDFNAEDEAIPARAQLSSPSPVPSSASSATPSVLVSSSPLASVSVSPSPQASTGRSAFFLIEPVEGGSYILDDEFIVDIKVSSPVEAANLFSAKISFDPTALEVSRIERGTALTSWAEEAFDNQAGTLALTAGLPTPGLKTEGDVTPTMARIIFKSKKIGSTNITITNASKIFSNSNNSDILKEYVSQAVAITAN